MPKAKLHDFRLCRSVDCTERSLRGRRLKGKGKEVLDAATKFIVLSLLIDFFSQS